jgi:hypothetical protein
MGSAPFSIFWSPMAAWEKSRNQKNAQIHWTFTIAAARRKLHKPQLGCILP